MYWMIWYGGAFMTPAGAESGPSNWAKPVAYHKILVRTPDISNMDMVAPGKPADVDD